MKKQFNQVKQFNESFELLTNEKPTLISKKEYSLRCHIMVEEIIEYKDACEAKDLTEVCDALIDEMYILIGKFHAHGISIDLFEKMFDEVHNSNMSKLEYGKPFYREDGKVLKGKDYFKPNLKQFLK